MRRGLACFLLAVWVFSLCACAQEKEKYTSYSFEYFDTVTSITGYAQSRAEFDAVCAEVYEILGEYHRLYDIYHTYGGINNLRTVNEAEGKAVEVDTKIIDLLEYAKSAYELTGGYTNAAMGSVLSIWHEYRETGEGVPDMVALRRAACHTDINNIIINKEESTVCLDDAEMKIDVGALAKGYAAEMAVRALEARGVSGYILNVGGNVCVLGAKADGGAWTVGIEDPSGDGYVEYLSLTGGAVVTSGSYQRFYYVDGVRYHHIISPDTLMPENTYVSVTVVAQSSALGDALSTALFSMEQSEGLALIESIDVAEAMWVYASGEKIYSSNFAKFILKK
ncbi:MAG: FAD:protein FMN transferase [Clostridia bacterium]|nr:FAD:protein FMN transferase [Clostridia bacterium]